MYFAYYWKISDLTVCIQGLLPIYLIDGCITCGCYPLTTDTTLVYQNLPVDKETGWTLPHTHLLSDLVTTATETTLVNQNLHVDKARIYTAAYMQYRSWLKNTLS